MKYLEEQGNVFDVDDKYVLAHCISADFALGAGIATVFDKKFNVREELHNNHSDYKWDGHGKCIVTGGRIFNLITKDRYWHKPTYETITEAIMNMKNIVEMNDIKYICMPKIGCGLDRLKWYNVSRIIQTVFADVDVEILIRYF